MISTFLAPLRRVQARRRLHHRRHRRSIEVWRQKIQSRASRLVDARPVRSLRRRRDRGAKSDRFRDDETGPRALTASRSRTAPSTPERRRRDSSVSIVVRSSVRPLSVGRMRESSWVRNEFGHFRVRYGCMRATTEHGSETESCKARSPGRSLSVDVRTRERWRRETRAMSAIKVRRGRSGPTDSKDSRVALERDWRRRWCRTTRRERERESVGSSAPVNGRV